MQGIVLMLAAVLPLCCRCVAGNGGGVFGPGVASAVGGVR